MQYTSYAYICLYIMGASEHFGTENYTWRLDTVQNLCEFCQYFLYGFLSPKCFDTSKSSFIALLSLLIVLNEQNRIFKLSTFTTKFLPLS